MRFHKFVQPLDLARLSRGLAPIAVYFLATPHPRGSFFKDVKLRHLWATIVQGCDSARLRSFLITSIPFSFPGLCSKPGRLLFPGLVMKQGPVGVSACW